MSGEKDFSRVLNNKDVLALAFGAMIGWGWVVLTGDWLVAAGTLGSIVAFAVGGLAVILIGLTYAELAAAMPVTGGEHVYSYRAMGMGASFLCTWSIILGYVSVVAFEAVALPTVVEHLFPNYKVGFLWSVAGWDVYLSWVSVGVGGAVLMTWINIRGIKDTALLQKVVTLSIVAAGIMLMTGSAFNGETANMEPIFVNAAKGTLAVLIMTPFMFVGFNVIPQAAEEINLPFNQIGRVLVFSVVLAVVWYVVIILAVSRALTAEEIEASTLASADAMTALFGGSWAGQVLVVAGIGGIVTSWNAFLVGGSRAIYAMARHRMLPSFLGKLHPTYKTPVNALLMIGTLSVLAPLFGRQSLGWLVNAGGLGIVVAYLGVALSFILLRRNEPDLDRPFKVPGGMAVAYTATALSVGLIAIYLLPFSPAVLIWPHEWMMVLFWGLAGLGLYLWARTVHDPEAVRADIAKAAPGPSDLEE